MFDIAWTELLVIAVVTILVVGPKELPRLLRTIGQYTSKIRTMANDFKAQLDDAVKDTGLDTIKSDLESIKDNNPVSDLRSALNPMSEDFEEDFKKLADEEDFDDPAAEDDGEDSWELWNDTDGNKPADAAENAAGDGVQIVEPASDKSAEKAEAESKDTVPPSPKVTPKPKATNGVRPPGLDTQAADDPLVEKSEV